MLRNRGPRESEGPTRAMIKWDRAIIAIANTL
jgi:hypothetical protein